MGNLHFPGVDFGHVQHIVDQRHQMLGRVADLLQTVLHPFPVLYVRCGDGGHADDGVHGRADLMGHPGKEIRFRPVCLLRHGQGVL